MRERICPFQDPSQVTSMLFDGFILNTLLSCVSISIFLFFLPVCNVYYARIQKFRELGQNCTVNYVLSQNLFPAFGTRIIGYKCFYYKIVIKSGQLFTESQKAWLPKLSD